MKAFHYTDGKSIIRIYGYRRPNGNTKSKTWTVYESSAPFIWNMAVFPEITWGILKTLEFVGFVKIED